MEKLERIYNKGMKALGITSLKETAKIIKDNFDNYIDIIPEDQLMKVSPKFKWNNEISLIGNIQILIQRNICEYVAKRHVKKGYKFIDGGIDSNEDYMIILSSDEKKENEDIEFNGDTYHIIYE